MRIVEALYRIKTRFNEILDRFVETFVAPRMAAIEGGEVAEVTSIIVSIVNNCTNLMLCFLMPLFIKCFKSAIMYTFTGCLPKGCDHEGGDARGPQHHKPTL